MKQERRPRAFVEIVNARTVDVDETSERRHYLLNSPRGPRRENGQPGRCQAEQQQHNADDPRGGHHRAVSGAGAHISGSDMGSHHPHFLNLRPRKLQ